MYGQTLIQEKSEEHIEFLVSSFLEKLGKGQAVLELGRKRHEVYRVIEDFRGPIYGQTYSLDGQWRYLPLAEEDMRIIPKAALVRHAVVEKECCPIAQVLIGHEIQEIQSKNPQTDKRMHKSAVIPKPQKQDIDWGYVGGAAAKGLLSR